MMNIDLQNIEISYVLYAVLGILLLIQLYYILFVYSKLALHKVKSFQQSTTTTPLSVIICAHNEEQNLKQFLPSVLNQDYPDFEVIVVNDYSTDETKWILEDFKRQYSNLYVVDIKEHIRLKNSKKFALTLGIKAAKNEILIMTDADCEPQSNQWLKEIAGAYAEGTELVLGYSPYFKKSGFLNKLIRFETAHTAMSYLSYALKRNAYMGVGRNLSYLKSLFFKGKGFNAHMHIKSGDDDLFVNQNATRHNVKIAIYPDAHVYSKPKETWKSYYKQKARHAGASVIYKKTHQRMLGTQLISAFAFYIMLITCLVCFPSLWYIGLGVFFLRYICQLIVFSSIYKKLAVRDLLVWLLVLDVFYYFYICLNGLFNRKKKQKSW
ncbi:glycosyltransferase [Sphingobacterium composti Ten et al. 2007 non Yoo et al. 2007]|uniref:glycosyltransferase n=1 Tax=Sphingobacterium composti TaxID=363260 RepID=UPI001F3B438C|nr:glycosyltransferase [Sphingobacterium composti Ten et al. 2007 non Yoo et al. 2007]